MSSPPSTAGSDAFPFVWALGRARTRTRNHRGGGPQTGLKSASGSLLGKSAGGPQTGLKRFWDGPEIIDLGGLGGPGGSPKSWGGFALHTHQVTEQRQGSRGPRRPPPLKLSSGQVRGACCHRCSQSGRKLLLVPGHGKPSSAKLPSQAVNRHVTGGGTWLPSRS